MNESGQLVRFEGRVVCRVDSRGPIGVTLTGRDRDGTVQVSFVTAAPRDFPPALAGAVVRRVAPGIYRIAEPHGERTLEAARAFVHRDVREGFERAVPPRDAPLVKRAFWRLVLALAATGPGRRLLRVLRG